MQHFYDSSILRISIYRVILRDFKYFYIKIAHVNVQLLSFMSVYALCSLKEPPTFLLYFRTQSIDVRSVRYISEVATRRSQERLLLYRGCQRRNDRGKDTCGVREELSRVRRSLHLLRESQVYK